MLLECVKLGIPLKTLDLRTCTADDRAVQLLSEIVVDVQGPVKEESGYLDGRRRGGAGVLGEEGGRDEKRFRCWDSDSDKSSDDTSDDDPHDTSDVETSSTDSQIVLS
jgi:hypothetical protein